MDTLDIGIDDQDGQWSSDVFEKPLTEPHLLKAERRSERGEKAESRFSRTDDASH